MPICVLMLRSTDIRQTRSTAGKTRIAAQEISDVQGLHNFYGNASRSGEAALRVIHVQNAPWAVYYLLRKFNINAPDNLLGMDFGSFVKHAKPEWRGGKPLLKGKTWRTQRDPWRGVRRTAFGMDYLRPCGVKDRRDVSQPRPGADAKMMELNGYDDSNAPAYSYDVFVQRLSVYVQFNDGVPPPEDLKNPYTQQNGDHAKEKNRGGNHKHKERALPPVDWLDNGNTIIIFENSRTRSVKDTLIAARNEIETRWVSKPQAVKNDS